MSVSRSGPSTPRLPQAQIEHVAIWTDDLERLRSFYEHYLGASAGPLHYGAATGLCAYYLDLCGARLELMHMPGLGARPRGVRQRLGHAHIGFSLGSADAVDELTSLLLADGYTVVAAPRRAESGDYESAVLDPDGNRIVLTV
jgi:lactoylglutathione lyase